MADLDIKKDARDIQNLGPNIDNIINVFEDIMTDIRKERYGEQQRLLVGYKKLLEEQINVIDARLKMAKRDRKSTRLNSSHANISYAVFCLKKKKKKTTR